MAKPAVQKIPGADRHELLEIYEQYRDYSNETLRRLIVEKNRVDILATAVLGLEVRPFHLRMLQFQFQHPKSLQLAFRSAGKTSICTVAKSIHMLCKDRDLRIIFTSKTKGNAAAFLKEVKSHLEGNTRLIEIFGPFYHPAKVPVWTDTEIEVLGRKLVHREASITCAGLDSTIVSKHYDVGFSDDLVDEDNSRTKKMRDKTRTWYYQTLDPTLMPPDPKRPHVGEHHHLGTRYHFDDLWGHLEENELHEHTNVVPALDENGNTPWPEKYPAIWFQEKKKTHGTIIFSAQYMCHAEDTEFLTDRGWLFWCDVDASDMLATRNMATGAFEYQHATGSTYLPYNGVLTHIKSKKIDALVTPNHSMICKPADYPPVDVWSRIDAEHIAKQASGRTGRVLLPSAGIWAGNEVASFHIDAGQRRHRNGSNTWDAYSAEHHGGRDVSMDVFVRFLGFFIAEGSTSSKSRGGIALSQNEGQALEEMKSLLREMSLPFKQYKGGNTVSLRFNHIGLWEWLRANVKTSSVDARIPRQFFSLARRQLLLLFYALMDGDGHDVPVIKREHYQYTTISKQLADDVSELGLLTGFDSSIKRRQARYTENNGKLYMQRHDPLLVTLRTANNNGIDPVTQVNKVAYVGNVVCFEVPNGTLITRRNGRTLVSGNCDTAAMRGEVFQYDYCQQISDKDWPDEASLHIFGGVDLSITGQDDKFATMIIGCQGTPNVGKDPDAIYIMEWSEEYLRFPQQGPRILNLYDKWDPISIGLEVNAFQLASYQDLKAERPGMRLIPVYTDKDKLTRAAKFSAYFEQCKVFFKKTTHGPLIDQLILFPNKGKDVFDALDLAVHAFKKRRKRRGDGRPEPKLL